MMSESSIHNSQPGLHQPEIRGDINTTVQWISHTEKSPCDNVCQESILDIRGKKHPGREIERWDAALSRLLLSAPEGTTKEKLLPYVDAYTAPPVSYFLKQLRESGRQIHTWNDFLDELFKQFEGIDRRKERDNKSQLLQEQAEMHLIQMRIQDMKCFQKFSEDYLYWSSQATLDRAIWAYEEFFNKLPPQWIRVVENFWNNREEYAETLGGKIRAVHDLIDKKCQEAQERKMFKGTTILCNRKDIDQSWNYTNCSQGVSSKKHSCHCSDKKKRTVPVQRRRRCFICNSDKHLANHCPKKQARLNVLNDEINKLQKQLYSLHITDDEDEPEKEGEDILVDPTSSESEEM